MPLIVTPVQDLYSLSGRTSYRQISWNLKAIRLAVIMIVPIKNWTGSKAAEVPVKFESDWKSFKPNFVVSKLHEILW